MTARLTPAIKRGFTFATSHRLRGTPYPSPSTVRCRSIRIHKPVTLPASPPNRSGSLCPSTFSKKSFLPLRTVKRMATNGEARPKRKQSPVSFLDRPAKHLRPEASAPTPGDATPQNGTVYNIENDIDEAPILNPLAAPADSPEWQATIENVVKSVVSIHFCQTCSFDTDLSMSSQATGFVVDAERGYIMTNRHVACAGPFWGYCIFDNHEEVSKPE
jgi:pro-apoptotic serine protease NMA111